MSQSPLLPKNNLKRYCFKISYNGSKFYGWAIQPNLKTIQGDIQSILKKLYNQKILIYGSGRTDAKVHALAQVFHFDAPSYIHSKGIVAKLNSYNIGIWNIYEPKIINRPFHARYSVKEKTYLYKIEIVKKPNPLTYDFVWQLTTNLLLNKMRKIAKLFVGEKNFLSFTTEAKENCIRKINSIKITKKNNCVYIKINGSGFLRHMVRMIVGCMVNFAIDKIDWKYCESLFKSPSKGKAIFKAPAAGLYLLKVKY